MVPEVLPKANQRRSQFGWRHFFHEVWLAADLSSSPVISLLLCDPLSTMKYLVGYSKRYNSLRTKKMCSFRLSALGSGKVEKVKKMLKQIYFFKFGKDAEIISPPALRDKFAAMYKEASHLYSTI